MTSVRLGLRANAAQFTLLVGLNALVGAMVGLERSVLPLVGEEEFGLVSRAAVLSFVVAFGVAKAFTNLGAGVLADRVGRKRLLVIGWLVALPVAPMIALAPSWGWIVGANVLLGINQGLAWSMTVVMKVDMAGPRRRGTALGINEAAGYVSVAAAAFLAGLIAGRYGVRPEPFYLGIGFAAAGTALSVLFVRDTSAFVTAESNLHPGLEPRPDSFRRAFAETTW